MDATRSRNDGGSGKWSGVRRDIWVPVLPGAVQIGAGWVCDKGCIGVLGCKNARPEVTGRAF